MPPTTFPYRASVIKRSFWLNAVLVALGGLYFMMARPLQWHWVDVAMLFGFCFYSVRFLYDMVRMKRPLPAVIVGDDGLRDPALGGILIPWAAIKEIRVGRARGLAQLFLIANSERLTADPSSIALKLANWARGARAGRKSADMALPMSPSVALEAALDDVLRDIRGRPAAASIVITES